MTTDPYHWSAIAVCPRCRATCHPCSVILRPREGLEMPPGARAPLQLALCDECFLAHRQLTLDWLAATGR